MNKIENFHGIVGMVDVLGFKTKIRSSNAYDEYNKFCDLTKEIFKTFDKNTSGGFIDILKENGNHVFLYSDTLIYVSKYIVNDNDSIARAFANVCSFAQRIILQGIENNFALRGCIASGDIFIENSINSIAGSAIVNAAEEHEISKWIGCHFHSSCDEMINNTLINYSSIQNRIKKNISMPIENSKKIVNCIDIFDSYAHSLYNKIEFLEKGYFYEAVSPHYSLSEAELIKIIQNAIIALFKKYRSLYPKFSEYPDNTLNILCQ